jgi:hypothetical protein
MAAALPDKVRRMVARRVELRRLRGGAYECEMVGFGVGYFSLDIQLVQSSRRVCCGSERSLLACHTRTGQRCSRHKR